MRVELGMEVRGGERTVCWEDGVLSGDEEVLRRLQPLIERGQVEVQDLLSVLRGTEQVTAQQVSVANLDLVEPEVLVIDGDGSAPPAADGPRRPAPFDGAGRT